METKYVALSLKELFNNALAEEGLDPLELTSDDTVASLCFGNHIVRTVAEDSTHYDLYDVDYRLVCMDGDEVEFIENEKSFTCMNDCGEEYTEFILGKHEFWVATFI